METEGNEFLEHKIAFTLQTYGSPVLLVIGLVGNILVFVVLAKSSMRLTTTSVYLRFLAVFDTLVLYIGLLRYWIIYLVDYDVREYSPVVCKIMAWAIYSVSYISVWLLVSVTLERCFSVWFPHKVKMICTKRKTYIIIVCIMVVMSLVNVHCFYGLSDGVITEDNETIIVHCAPINDDYYEFQRIIWPWMDIFIYSFLPSSVLTACNISIIYKVVSSSRQALRNDSSNNIQSRNLSARQSQASSLTAMLVVTSATYVICSTPFCSYMIYYNAFNNIPNSPHEVAVDELVWSFINILMYTNHSINFILYCVSGQRFRKELRALFSVPVRNRPVTSVFNLTDVRQ